MAFKYTAKVEELVAQGNEPDQPNLPIEDMPEGELRRHVSELTGANILEPLKQSVKEVWAKCFEPYAKITIWEKRKGAEREVCSFQGTKPVTRK